MVEQIGTDLHQIAKVFISQLTAISAKRLFASLPTQQYLPFVRGEQRRERRVPGGSASRDPV